jgi:hypothetical protein
MADGYILKSKAATPTECLHYALSLPTATVITGIERMDVLRHHLEAVRTFRPLTLEQIQALLAKTAPAAAWGQFEPFKTSNGFDSTAKPVEWLGAVGAGPG